MSKKIVVVGAGGQLGRCISDIVTSEYSGVVDDFSFLNHKNLDITNQDDVFKTIVGLRPDVVINCAAYTNVNEAENDITAAFDINCMGPRHLAQVCNTVGAKLVHISTDYVFDGKANIPYKETDDCRPINFYGMTKYLGEREVLSVNPESIIIRTSWLYSWYGNNFFTKMITKIDRGEKFGVVYDVVGTPTYAFDLANFIISLIPDEKYKDMQGIYNYSNSGAVSRYDFAAEIERLYTGRKEIVQPCLSTDFIDPVKKPTYTVFDHSKTESVIGKHIPDWRVSLEKCIYSKTEKKR